MLNTFGVKVGESYGLKKKTFSKAATREPVRSPMHETYECYRLEDARLSFLRDETNVDMWRDLEVVPF